MGIPFSIPCDPCINKVFHWLDEKVACTHNLEKNLTALENTMEELKAKRDDLSRRVTREEDRGLQRLSEIQVWLNRVETIEKKVNDLISARDVELQRLCICGFCSKSLISSYRYGKGVYLTLREVEKLKSEVFVVIAEQAQISEVLERQLQPTIVGQSEMLDKAWKHLNENGVGIMGMHGMGGVGKTTLLTQLYNKFSHERCGFDLVIWVVVSKELNVENIQDEIAQKVGLGEEKSHKTEAIFNFLRKKRFVLFLDDIWEKVDLAAIGVPFPTTQNRCKVAFTTRSQDVCARMGVEEPMEVQCLADNEAFDVRSPKVENWKVVRRMSLMNNKILRIGGSPECLELTTLLLQNTNFKKISSEFFKSMPKLVVLDLSGNEYLSDLPDGISELVSLQYLNLSNTGIGHLPMGLQKLKKLIHLNLVETTWLLSIAGISNLHNLKVLKLYGSGFDWDLSIVEELESLEHLEILTTEFFSSSLVLEQFLSSQRLTSFTRYLQIKDMHLESSGISLPVTMDKLRDFRIENCSISEIKMVSPLHNPRNPCFSSLSKVFIHECKCSKS